MAEELKHPLKVFLCHASGDKPAVRALYQRLVRDGVDAWLDKEKLLPGQDWQLEIPKAVRESDVVVVCLSKKSTTKEGYVQKEIKFALDIASEKPEGTIFLIPARLEDCDVPSQLGPWQWVDLFESDGYEWLMRSLQLRADKLGLGVGETLYTDSEFEQKLDQLYTEGLAALWVEDWDKACHRFQSILREKPDHMQAAAKLEEAKRQKYLSDLYVQVLNAHENENWQAAVELLEKLTGEVADYKDTSILLKNAQKRNQLTRLYEEARKLYKAKQWQAVTRVFTQIDTLEPNYPDPDGLRYSAEKEVIELKRLANLNDLYRRGVREMEVGQWYEARRLFVEVHKTETGFLETERLLRKIEDEIRKIEELEKRNFQINTLYEQAHGLVRSKNWREALKKLEEIYKLDNQFDDKDGVAKESKAALEIEEQEAQKQNQLAAMYAEAVQLLKEEKYQGALDKWQEIKAVDSRYPDRQHLTRTLRKNLKGMNGKIRANGASMWWRIKLLPALIFLGAVGMILFFVLNPNILSSLWFRHEYPVQFKIITSSDWTEIQLKSGGKLQDVKVLSKSNQATEASYAYEHFTLRQPLYRADGINTVEMIASATITDITPNTTLIVEGKRGCIGKTTIEVSKVYSKPTLVKSMAWGYDCSGDNLHTFEVPIELFTK